MTRLSEELRLRMAPEDAVARCKQVVENGPRWRLVKDAEDRIEVKAKLERLYGTVGPARLELRFEPAEEGTLVRIDGHDFQGGPIGKRALSEQIEALAAAIVGVPRGDAGVPSDP